MQNSYGRQTAPDIEYAGFWVRLAAYCIDCAIVWVGLLFVNLVIGILSVAGSGVFRTEILFQYTAKDILLYVLQVLYFVLLTHGTGTTPGKRLLNLYVVNADGSQKLELLNVIYRETVGRFLCGLSIGVGYIMAGVDREKRGLHDMLCDTRVVYAKKMKVLPVYQAPANCPPPQGYYGPIPPRNNNMSGTGNTPVPPRNNNMAGAGNAPVSPRNNSVTGSGNVPVSPQNNGVTGFGNTSVPPRDNNTMSFGNAPISPQNNGATGFGNIPVPPQNNSLTGTGNAPVPPQNSSMTGIGNASVLPKDHVPPKLESDLASSASAEVEAQEKLTSDGAEALDQKEKRD